MSLEQTIRDTLVSESMDLDARLQQLVRAGLMPQNTLPLLRKSISKVQMGLSLQGPERDVMATFINSMMYIVLGDDTIFNKARAGAKSYAAEETEVEEAVGDYTVKTVSPADLWKKHTERKKAKINVPVDPKTGKTLYQKVTSEEVEDLEELSRATVGRYAKRAKDEADYGNPLKSRAKGREMAARKRWGGTSSYVKPARVPATEEVEQIDELSPATMGRYIKKAADRMSTQGVTAGLKIAKDEKSQKNFDTISKRARGISTAVKKLTKESRKTDALVDIAAIKQMNESYKTTFDAALETYGIKSPSELDEEKRKEFFNFVDQNYKKGDN